MKRLLLVPVILSSTLFLGAPASAAGSNTFYVQSAYYKTKGLYDVVVHDPNKDTLRIYVNDKQSVKAKVNKQGWATFQKVALSGQSKLSFQKRSGLFKYVSVPYTKYVRVNGKQVTMVANGPKHSYEDFAKWLGTEVQYAARPGLPTEPMSQFNAIRTKCGTGNGFDDSVWISCMQTGYQGYLKPEIFVGQDNQLTALDLIGFVDGVNQYGLNNSFSSSTQADVDAHRATYDKFAVTN